MVSVREIQKVLVVAENGRIYTCPLELVKGPKGDDGDTPSETYLRELIKELTPDPIPGDPGAPGEPGITPSDERLKSLIEPLIPEPLKGDPGEPGAPGKSPTDEHISALITKQLPSREQLCDLLIPYIPPPRKGEPGVSPRVEDILKALPPYPNEEDIRRLIQELLPPPGPPMEGLPPLPTVRRANRILGTDHKGKLGWLAAVVGATGRSLVHERRITTLEQNGGGGNGVGGGGTWGSIIGTLADQLDLQAELDALYAAIAGIGGSAAQNTFLVSGGQVVWIGQYQFLVSAATYYIGGSLFTSAQQIITLDASHLTLDRIDVIAVDSTGTVVKITGTAATEPSEPDTDPGSQLKLSIVFVGANTIAPGTSSTEPIYSDFVASGEWDMATSGAGWTLNSTTDPRSGTMHIDATAVGASSYVEATIPNGGTLDPSLYDFLVFNIKPKSQWSNNRGLQITMRLAGVVKGGAVVVQRSGTFGFDSGDTSQYQQIAIPTGLFAIPPGVLINQVRASVFGGAINFRADDIAFIGGANAQPQTGITQEQADARYGSRFVQRGTDILSVLTVADGQDYFRIPPGLNGWRLSEVSGGLVTAGTTMTTVQLAKVPLSGSTVDLLSTKLTIDANERDSSQAATQPVITAANAIVATGDRIRVDIDVAGTNAVGLIVDYTFVRA